MDLKLYLQHKITVFHFRDRHSDKPSHLLICRCGWKPWWFRKYKYAILYLRVKCILGHKWDEWETISMGPAGFEESEDYIMGYSRICNRCYKTETKDKGE